MSAADSLWRFGVTLLCAAACGGSSQDATSDAGSANLEPPPECALTELDQDFVYPTAPYGIEVGDTFEEISLDDCDGNELQFRQILSQAELVLFNVGAGWCEPCIEETETLDAEVFREFCGRGLRVVQVIFQDDQSRPATSLFCRQWKERFSLSLPVLYDPLFVTGRYFESVQAQTPINYLVNSSGEIVFKETGTAAADLTTRIDGLLPAE